MTRLALDALRRCLSVGTWLAILAAVYVAVEML